MIQLILHLIGDYLIQSDWMATEKVKNSKAAFSHAFLYSILFLPVTSLLGWSIIFTTHFVIDRYRLAKYVIFAKNFLAPPSYWRAWEECNITGYSKDLPDWLAFWLLIIADNTIHLVCNYVAIALFPNVGF